MPLILRSFSGREVKQNSSYGTHRRPCPRLRVTSEECPVRRRADFSAREASPNPPQRGRAPTKDRFEIADPKNSHGEDSSGKAAAGDRFEIAEIADPKNLQRKESSGKAQTRGGFEIENLIERLEKSTIEAENVKSQRYERSQEVVENKGKCFSHSFQSQEVLENKGVIFVKPRGY